MALNLWSKLSKTPLDALDQEVAALSSDKSHMILKYELHISINGEEGQWRTCYQFADRPDNETLNLLREQAVDTYEEIYGGTPTNSHFMTLHILPPDKREQLPTIRK